MKIPMYFIESTAPNNVDDIQAESIERLLAGQSRQAKPRDDGELESIDSNKAVEEIATILAEGAKPNLVVMVHGFNNAESDVLKMYQAAASAVNSDNAICQRHGLVCVGYRWPSEKMFTPLGSTWKALAKLPRVVLLLGVLLVALSLALFLSLLAGLEASLGGGLLALSFTFIAHVFAVLGWVLLGLILMAILLRAIVYFRDTYRATNYGVPDLVQVVRAIESQLRKLRGEERQNDIELSFIGHSMGGLVVTNAIRTLSDVFATKVASLDHFGSAGPKPDEKIQHIGKAFVLKRFVLASPDIPAETLLSDRGNFLGSVLSRFEEAYLFSNEGDEVLRQISTLANYFVFPTKSSDHGFRLGNTEILSSGYGIVAPDDDFLSKLRIGRLTLRELYDALERAETSRRASAGCARDALPIKKQARLPKVFTYFDCTDYVDEDNDEQTRPLLTFAKCNKRSNAKAALPFTSHLALLAAYLRNPERPNVHGGYFEGRLSQRLIYQLACLGYEATQTSFGGAPRLAQACADRQIRVLLSPSLDAPGTGPAAARVSEL